MGSQGKHAEDPGMKRCDVASSIQVELCLWIANFPSASVPPWKRSNRVRSEAKTKASVHCSCFILKLSPLEPTQSGICLVAARPHGHMLLGEREYVNTPGECMERSKRETVSLIPWDYISLGLERARCFSKTNNFPSLCGY